MSPGSISFFSTALDSIASAPGFSHDLTEASQVPTSFLSRACSGVGLIVIGPSWARVREAIVSVVRMARSVVRQSWVVMVELLWNLTNGAERTLPLPGRGSHDYSVRGPR